MRMAAVARVMRWLALLVAADCRRSRGRRREGEE